MPARQVAVVTGGLVGGGPRGLALSVRSRPNVSSPWRTMIGTATGGCVVTPPLRLTSAPPGHGRQRRPSWYGGERDIALARDRCLPAHALSGPLCRGSSCNRGFAEALGRAA